MINENTARREIKFVSNEHHMPSILSWLHGSKLFLKKCFEDRIVNNIYYDTFNYEAYSDNLSGISNRTKLRYRWYGNTLEPTDGFLELKIRKNSFGFKKRLKINLSNIDNKHKKLSEFFRKSAYNLWTPFINYYSNPVLLNRYRRSYYLSKCKKIRLTLDRNHSLFDQRFSNKINTKKKLNIIEYIVIEIKCDPKLFNYVSNLIEDIPMKASRNSKYVNSVNALNSI